MLLGLDDEDNDHWVKSVDYKLQSVGQETFEGDKYGVINEKRWNEATNWLLKEKERVDHNFGLDASIW